MPSDVADISAALAYQVKKEIAENYFGTRKTLEIEREELEAQYKNIQAVWDQTVLPKLIQIGHFLMGAEECRAFLDLIRRGDLLEPLLSALQSQGLAATSTECPMPFGLTVKGRYKKLIYNLYQKAKTQGDTLWEEFRLLQKKAKLFNEDLAKFSSNYQLSEILTLIHSITLQDDLKGVLGENIDPQAIPLLEEKLILKPISLVREEETGFRPLPPWKEVQVPLNLLLDQIFQTRCPEIKKIIRPA